MTALLVDGNGDVLELLLHLVGLVANLGHRGLVVGLDEPLALALIAPAQHRHIELVLQQTNQILHMRCLARTAYGDVAHADDGYLEGTRLQHPHFKQGVARLHCQAVNPAERQKPLIGFDEVSLHTLFLISYLSPLN